jgi:hypothetical protein
MTLRNALGDLALDATVADVKTSVDALGELDYATEAKLEQVRGLVALLGSEATLSAVSGKIGTPASDDLMTLLRAIEANTAANVTRADTLNLTADQVQLNTDTVEALLADLSARIGTTGVAGSAAAILDAIRLLLTGSLTINLPAGAALDATLTNGSLRVGGTVDIADRGARVLGHVTVDSAPSTLPTGAATEATLASVLSAVALLLRTGDLVGLDATTLAALETVSVANFPVTQPVSGTVSVSGVATDASLGALTETAPASDTASSGLNGRLQRIAQRLTSLIALLPGSLGQKASAASLAVVVASDQSAVPVSAASLPLPASAAKDSTLTDGTQRVGGTVAVSNASLPLPNGASTEATLAALNAKAAGDTTNGLVTQARADAVTTGNITASGQSVPAAVVPGMAAWSFYTDGTYATGASLRMEVSFDGGGTYVVVRMLQVQVSTLGYVLTIAQGANAVVAFTAEIPPGVTHLRVTCTAWASPAGSIGIKIGQARERMPAPTSVISTLGQISGSIVPGVTAGNLGKAEDAAHTSGDTGVAVWGVRNDALTVLSSNDGDYSVLATDGRGAVLTNGAMFAYSHIATAATTTVKSGAGYLRGIVVNSKGTVASTVTVYDNTAGSGTVIAIIDSLTLSGTFTFECAFSTGLTIVTTGTVAPDITVCYR